MTTIATVPSKIVPALYDEFGMTYDGDVYGWANGWAFAIADVIHDRDTVPAHWHYSPGLNPPRVVHMAANEDANFSYEQETVATLLLNRQVTIPDLLYAGEVWYRYRRLVTILGHSY